MYSPSDHFTGQGQESAPSTITRIPEQKPKHLIRSITGTEEVGFYPGSPVGEQSDRVHPTLRQRAGDVRESGAYAAIIVIEKNRSTSSHLDAQTQPDTLRRD